ncbi:MAG: hypothetical protein HOP28_09015 [Gemmatimonadales bacterium]|nr:hypothetical protein [Gemmatimonadales bacterium]
MAKTVDVPVTAPASEPTTEHHPAALVWLQRNSKVVSYAAVAVGVIIIGGWLFIETGQRKATAAFDALDRARTAAAAGNLPTASAEFQRVAQNFAGTEAGYQAELALNEVRLASGQAQIAADELRKFADKNPPAFYAAGAWFMLGGALENLKKFDEAAAAYAKSAERAEEPYRKVDGLLGAARAYHLAGKEKESVDVLRGIVSKYGKDTPGVAEAEVRLAERTQGRS